MRDIEYQGDRVGVRGRFTLTADRVLRSHGPDLRLLGVEVGRWMYIYGDRSAPIALARVADEPTAEAIQLDRMSWGEMPPLSIANDPILLAAHRTSEKAKALEVLAASGELSIYISKPFVRNVLP